MSIIDNILQEARDVLNLEKRANDSNGAPDSASGNKNSGQDIISTASAFLQDVEQFKASLQTNAQDPNAQDPNAQDPNAQDPNAQDPNVTGATIQTPGGSVIKIGSIIKLSSLFSKTN